MSSFLKRYSSLGHDLSRQLVSSAGLFADPGVASLANGVVVGGTPAEATKEQRAFAGAFANAFPSIPAAGALNGLSLAYDIGVEAAVSALIRAGGETGKPFLDALGALGLDSPLGSIRLDGNRQAIGPNYLSRVDGAAIRTLTVVPGVEQTFGGYFTSAGPPPSEDSPTCVRRAPPPWTR
jgi:hypothetical protein